MRKIIPVLILMLLNLACSNNKSVTEELSLDEVSALVSKDTLYEKIILDVEQKRKLFKNDIVLRSKFKDLSYSDYYDYLKSSVDTNFTKVIYEKAEKEYNSKMDSILKIYKTRIDSKFVEYKMKKRKMDPSNYFRVEFSSISKEYYSYSYDVKNVEIKFKITPLQGPIQGGSFNYEIIPNVTEKSVADGGCRFSSYTSRPSVYTWEAPYDVEKELKYSSTSKVKDNYTIKYTILSARQKGKTFKLLDQYDIPIEFGIYLDKASLSQAAYQFILSSYYKVNVETKFEIFNIKLAAYKKKINPIAFEFEKLKVREL